LRNPRILNSRPSQFSFPHKSYHSVRPLAAFAGCYEEKDPSRDDHLSKALLSGFFHSPDCSPRGVGVTWPFFIRLPAGGSAHSLALNCRSRTGHPGPFPFFKSTSGPIADLMTSSLFLAQPPSIRPSQDPIVVADVRELQTRPPCLPRFNPTSSRSRLLDYTDLKF